MILDMLDGSKSGPQLEIDLVRINPLRSPGLHLRVLHAGLVQFLLNCASQREKSPFDR